MRRVQGRAEGKYEARGELGEFCQYQELCEGVIFLVLSPASLSGGDNCCPVTRVRLEK